MTSKPIRIGNGAGFWGDDLLAPLTLAKSGNLDYLTLDYLAELSLALLAHQRQKSPDLGYVPDFLTVLEGLIPVLKEQPNLKIITNAGGLNPIACAQKASYLLTSSGLNIIKLGVVYGDDIVEDHYRHHLHPLDEDQKTANQIQPMIQANAYLGAEGIVNALSKGSQIVITGRVADVSLTVAPCVYEFNWSWQDTQKLAQASVAGHLIECGAQVTGGMLYDYTIVPNPESIGYPIAIIDDQANVTITKPEGSGGLVNSETVTSQLVYEVGDPASYITPDVIVDLRHVSVEEEGENNVTISGALGKKAPDQLKVSCSYALGYQASHQLVLYGPYAMKHASICAQMIRKRVEKKGYLFDDFSYELLGAGAVVPGHVLKNDCHEVVLKIFARSENKECMDVFCKEFAPLITSGPGGVTGYTGRRPKPIPAFGFWPGLIDRHKINIVSKTSSISTWKEEITQ